MLRLAGASGTARLARACFLVLNLIASIPPKEAAILAGEAVSGSCLDSSYSWVRVDLQIHRAISHCLLGQTYNSQGLTPCQVEAELMQSCNNSAGAVYPCICNSVGYSLWAACSLCIEQPPHSFSIYLSDAHCPQMYDAPSSNVANVPGWANLPLIDDETFDVQAAEQEAGGIQPSGSASSSRTVTPSVQSHSPQSSSTSRTSAQTSEPTSSTQPPDPSIAQESSGSLPNTGVQTAETSQPTAQLGQSSGSRPSGALTGTSQPQSSQETQADAPTSPPRTSVSPGPTQPTNIRSSSRRSSVIGGVVGSAITVVILATVGFLARRWRHRGGSRFKLFNSGSPGHEPLNIGPEEKGNVEEGEDVRVDPRFATRPMAEEPFIPASYTLKVYVSIVFSDCDPPFDRAFHLCRTQMIQAPTLLG
ncbi:hypothetical protein C8Q70DRAFT_478776 [Cubamyces menziesii]|nr:hypothetical protein C8Q70DRAFT_478776 [Cubamyces menziesii]